MNKIFILFTLISLPLLGDNLIKNGQFSDRSTNSPIPHWKIYPKKLHKDAEVAIDSTISKTGGRSVRITHKNNNTNLYSRIDQLHIPCKPHTRYIASFYAKGKDIHTLKRGGARMFIGPHGDLMRPITSFGPGFEQFRKTIPDPWSFEWKRYESGIFNSGDSKELGVTLFLHNASGTVWFDNIEIYEYSPDLQKERQAAQARKLIRDDIQTVRKQAPELSGTLSVQEKETLKYAPGKRDYRSGMPFFKIQRQLGVIFSSHLRKLYPKQELVLSPVADPLKRQNAFMIPSGKLPAEITLYGLQNEPESFAVNVTNVSAKEKTVKIGVTPDLPLTVRLATHVESDSTECVDDALPLIPVSGNIVIPAGMTRQLYITADLKKSCSGILNIGSAKIKIILKPVRTPLPKRLPIRSFSYAYLYHPHFMIRHYAKTQKMMSVMHDDLVHPYQFHSPLPVFNEEGKIVPEQMDWSKTDLHLKMKKQPAGIMIVLSVKQNPHLTETLGKDHGKVIRPLSPEWERRIILWMRELVKGLSLRGIGYDRFYVNFVDEPSADAVGYIEKIAKVIRKADPKIRIYNNFHYALSKKDVERLGKCIDILAPELEILTPDLFAVLHRSGKEIWVYHVQNRTYPADKIRDYFRMLKRENIKGYSYWCFAGAKSMWLPSQTYSAVYDDKDEWVPSKRSEAIKDGLEDYTLLALLEKKNHALYRKLISKTSSLSRNEWRKQALDALQK